MDITDHTIQVCDIKVSLLELRVWRGEEHVHFTLTELRILLAFLVEPTKLFTREELLCRADLTNLSSLLQVIDHLRALLNEQYVFPARDGLGYSFLPIKNKRRIA